MSAIAAGAALVFAPEITIPVALGGALVGGTIDVGWQYSEAQQDQVDANGNPLPSTDNFSWFPSTLTDTNSPLDKAEVIVGIAVAITVVYLIFRRK